VLRQLHKSLAWMPGGIAMPRGSEINADRSTSAGERRPDKHTDLRATQGRGVARLATRQSGYCTAFSP